MRLYLEALEDRTVPSISKAGTVGALLPTGRHAGDSAGAVPNWHRQSVTGGSQLIIDDAGSGFAAAGNWVQIGTEGYGPGIHYSAAGDGSSTATWTFTGLAPGQYRVSATWDAAANRADNAPFTLLDGATLLNTVAVNQQLAPVSLVDGGTSWQDLGGPYYVVSGTLTVQLTNAADGFVIADALRVERLGDLPAGPSVQVLVGSKVIAPGSTVDFGNLLRGDSRTETFSVRNLGAAPLILSDPISLPTGFHLARDFATTSVAPGASTSFTVRWRASAVGPYGGTLSFGTSDPANTMFSFNLTGAATGFSTSSAAAGYFEQWINHYVDTTGIPFTEANTARLIMAAQRKMYLQAVTTDTDVGGTLSDLVRNSPSVPYWALCGPSVDFLVQVFHAFNIAAHPVNQFSTWNDGHVTLEYYSSVYRKFVWYDPLYGVWLLNNAGIPAGIRDIENEIALHGFNSTTWSFQPVRIYGLDADPPVAALDPRYQPTNALPYSAILQSYFNLVAVQDEYYGYADPASGGASGRFTVYDNTAVSTLSAADRSQLVKTYLDTYSITRHGHDVLTIKRLPAASP